MTTTSLLLQSQQYGKCAIRLVHVGRAGGRHELTDLDVNITLTGDLADTYLTGDNTNVLATDSQKNTVYAFAKQHGINRVEDFALLLARHFVRSQDAVTGSRVAVSQHRWDRITPEHSFVRAEGELRTATITHDGSDCWVVGGITGLTLLNSTNSEFTGYPKDPYTTLPETTDRILATSVDARWRYRSTKGDWDKWHEQVRGALLAAFSDTYSRSLQQTLYAMGRRALETCADVVEIRLSLPNKHHIPVDLSPFGLDNANEVFIAPEQPYGLIEGVVAREDAPPPGLAWW